MCILGPVGESYVGWVSVASDRVLFRCSLFLSRSLGRLPALAGWRGVRWMVKESAATDHELKFPGAKVTMTMLWLRWLGRGIVVVQWSRFFLFFFLLSGLGRLRLDVAFRA